MTLDGCFHPRFALRRMCCSIYIFEEKTLKGVNMELDIESLMYEEESYNIRGAIFEVYSILGSGYLEEVYQNALEEELGLRNIPFEAKKRINIVYKGRNCGNYYSPDFICYDKIIVEIKAAESIHEKHKAQLMNYLKATGYKVGFLVNFGSYPKVSIYRVVN